MKEHKNNTTVKASFTMSREVTVDSLENITDSTYESMREQLDPMKLVSELVRRIKVRRFELLKDIDRGAYLTESMKSLYMKKISEIDKLIEEAELWSTDEDSFELNSVD